MRGILLTLLVAAGSFGACATAQQAVPDIDAEQLLRDVEVLAADSMEGRFPGTAGIERARTYLLSRFAEIGLEPFGASFEQRFAFTPRRQETEVDGVNLVGHILGSRYPDRYIVVTAHYDHLGMRNGEIFNGADDNASGTAGLLALAAYMRRNQPAHSFIFVALDAEEQGMRGARTFVDSPPVPLENIVLNVNFDMISRNDQDELYAAGTYHYEFLKPFIEEVAARAPVNLLMGHDQPGVPGVQDWTTSSDHAAFHRAGIPFIYFGVEDHPDYHRPTDTFDRIQPDFFFRSATTILDAVRVMDAGLGEVRRDSPLALEPALSSPIQRNWP